MRLGVWTFVFVLLIGNTAVAATESPASNEQLEITADKSLEWHDKANLYVARGNAKATQGDLTVSADLLSAHTRDKKAKPPLKRSAQKNNDASGDIDKMTAEGSVVITKADARITGDRAVYNLDTQTVTITGKQAVAIKGDRRINGDTLTAEFREQPNGRNELQKMTATGSVTVVTKADVVRGDKGIYDASQDMAIISGNVRISRPDGTVLTGDVAEANFKTNQSRLMNDGSGRVRALLPARAKPSNTKEGTP